MIHNLFSDVQRSINIPVLVGSGVTQDNVDKYIDANAFIVGSYFKKGGHWMEELDGGRVERFMKAVCTLRGNR